MTQHAALASDHRTRILDAAQRCFVRAGFHRATMQDVAAEAGMSAGNIYRYFSSKDALIAGLCARDRADLARSFGGLQSSADPFVTFMAIGQNHLVDEPREKAIFALELWAEAARSAPIASICRDFEADVHGWMKGFLVHLKASGAAHPDLAVTDLTELLLCLADGLLARRARDEVFDPAPHMAHIGDVLRLACAGQMPSMLTHAASSRVVQAGQAQAVQMQPDHVQPVHVQPLQTSQFSAQPHPAGLPVPYET